jgi:hypothetical protein
MATFWPDGSSKCQRRGDTRSIWLMTRLSPAVPTLCTMQVQQFNVAGIPRRWR